MTVRPAAAAAERAPAIWRFGDDPQRLAAALDRGAVLAIPTESTYGLAVDPTHAAGVAAILRLKGERERAARALPVVAGTVADLLALGISAEDPALAWGAARWPAPLSVVVPLARPIPASLGASSLAVRVPAHAPLRALLTELGRPLTATSANRSGEPPYTEAERVAAWLRGVPDVESVVIDGGQLPGGLPSTLVALEGGQPRILRPGRHPLA